MRQRQKAKKSKFKIPKKAKQVLVFAGLVALVILGLNIFFKLQTEEPRAKPRETTKNALTRVYFIKEGRVAPVVRELAPDENPLRKVINELLKGPTNEERKEGYITGIPKECRALNITVNGGAAQIIFNQKLEEFSGGAGKVETMLAQIVYTATEIPGINKVLIKIKGRSEIVLGGEGLVLDRPLSRSELLR
ncbi:MAG: GerMN domain-containing protein [bacterium]